MVSAMTPDPLPDFPAIRYSDIRSQEKGSFPENTEF